MPFTGLRVNLGRENAGFMPLKELAKLLYSEAYFLRLGEAGI